MNEGERKQVDAAAGYRYVSRGDEPVGDASWRSCRLVVTNERLLVVTDDGTRAVDLSDVEVLSGADVPADVDTRGGTVLRIGDVVVVIEAREVGDLALELHRAAVQSATVFARSPVESGADPAEEPWRRARLGLRNGSVLFAFADDDTASFDLSALAGVETTEESVEGETRPVVIGRFDGEDGEREAHVAGPSHVARHLAAAFERLVSLQDREYELSDVEREVLSALYSGVSPLEVAEFVAADVAAVEEAYQNLIEAGALERIRVRTEVELTDRGRNMASETLSREATD